MKSYSVTIQMKPLWQCFCMIPSVFSILYKMYLEFFLNFDFWRSWKLKGSSEEQGPVVQKLDSAIHRINHYQVDNTIVFANAYPLDSDLSGG